MSERIEFPVGDRPSLDLRTHAGSVEVLAGERGRIVVTAEQPDRWDISHIGDAVMATPAGRRSRRTGRIMIEVPAGARVELRAASAELRIEGDLGALTASTASGDLRHHGRCDTLRASTASGGVRSLGVDGDAEVTTVSGDVELGEVAGRVDITTTSGDVRIAEVTGDLSIGSTSGDVRVGRAGGTELSVRTISGDVRVGLPTGIRVVPELVTFSGRTRLPDKRRDTGTDDERPRRMVRLGIKSVSGDIDIERAD